ncbi:MAG: hypothetical protein M5U24_12150 [Candidatus Kuenenia sp.]|uniref:hypothetical protein n=1 Tax=Candidatus Kuenenia sp. TaxID=2499824 RepID=UPI0022C082F1|nr:hypothetical protein [Candidatus Kuenenia sp.]MCZ7623207.1 hypothetical protein [Candidatus Kuenenia sp.]
MNDYNMDDYNDDNYYYLQLKKKAEKKAKRRNGKNDKLFMAVNLLAKRIKQKQCFNIGFFMFTMIGAALMKAVISTKGTGK